MEGQNCLGRLHQYVEYRYICIEYTQPMYINILNIHMFQKIAKLYF